MRKAVLMAGMIWVSWAASKAWAGDAGPQQPGPAKDSAPDKAAKDKKKPDIPKPPKPGERLTLKKDYRDIFSFQIKAVTPVKRIPGPKPVKEPGPGKEPTIPQTPTEIYLAKARGDLKEARRNLRDRRFKDA